MDWIELGYLGLFLATFLAATIVPFSSELVLVGMIAMGYDWKMVVLVASVGNTAGGLSSYGLGYLASFETIEKWLRSDRKSILKWKIYIKKYGHCFALLCWLPFAGDVIAIALGVFKVSLKPVATLMFIGKAARYTLLGLLLSS